MHATRPVHPLSLVTIGQLAENSFHVRDKLTIAAESLEDAYCAEICFRLAGDAGANAVGLTQLLLTAGVKRSHKSLGISPQCYKTAKESMAKCDDKGVLLFAEAAEFTLVKKYEVAIDAVSSEHLELTLRQQQDKIAFGLAVLRKLTI